MAFRKAVIWAILIAGAVIFIGAFLLAFMASDHYRSNVFRESALTPPAAVKVVEARPVSVAGLLA